MCRGCTDQPPTMDRTSIDIDDGATLELEDMFCYLDDMLTVDGDDDASVEAKVCKGWNKLKKLVPLLSTNKHVSLLMKGKLYTSCAHRYYMAVAVKRGQ